MAKLCPLKFITPKDRIADEVGWNCKEDCAWWDRLAGDCAITVIAKLGLEGSFNAINKEVVK